MDDIFLWVLGSAGGLLVLAAAVAVWEHLRRSVRPQDEFTSATPKAVSIDLRLDRLTARPVPAATPAAIAASDIGQRRAALDEVLARIAQPAAASDSPLHWADTTPMVGPGQLAPLAPQREFSPSQQPR